MLTEVNDVLKAHFGKMLEKVKKETSEIEQTTRILRDLPFVRALQAELEKQKAENQTLGRQNLSLLQENVTLKARMKATETERVSLEIKEIEGDVGGGAEDLSEHIYGACHAEDADAAAAVAAAWEMVKTAPLDGSEEEEDESEKPERFDSAYHVEVVESGYNGFQPLELITKGELSQKTRDLIEHLYSEVNILESFERMKNAVGSLNQITSRFKSVER